uniref:PAS fold-3 domain-containing protein n=1 Tax=Glossina palpalis gambiensis TaxID=67801 RepID=A0A1B0B1I2_9MUSC
MYLYVLKDLIKQNKEKSNKLQVNTISTASQSAGLGANVPDDHLRVLTKGQGETARYRFLGKYGGYCWLVTQATIVYEKLKPHSVICVNYVISFTVGKEKNNE